MESDDNWIKIYNQNMLDYKKDTVQKVFYKKIKVIKKEFQPVQKLEDIRKEYKRMIEHFY
jgi:hypothetical protein